MLCYDWNALKSNVGVFDIEMYYIQLLSDYTLI